MNMVLSCSEALHQTETGNSDSKTLTQEIILSVPSINSENSTLLFESTNESEYHPGNDIMEPIKRHP